MQVNRVYKFRTELSERGPDVEELSFNKNVFKFTDVNPFEKVTIKVGCFKMPKAAATTE